MESFYFYEILTEGHPLLQVLLGMLLTLTLQSLIFLCLCLNKFRRILRQSRLQISFTEVAQPPAKPTEVRQQKLFLNKFTEQVFFDKFMQERQFKHRKLQSGLDDNFKQQINIKSGQIEDFLERLMKFYKGVQIFQQSLKSLGHDLRDLTKPDFIFYQHDFTFVQEQFPQFNFKQSQHNMKVIPSWRSIINYLNQFGKQLLKVMPKVNPVIEQINKQLYSNFISLSKQIWSVRGLLEQYAQQLQQIKIKRNEDSLNFQQGKQKMVQQTLNIIRNQEALKSQNKLESLIIQNSGKLQKLLGNFKSFQKNSTSHVGSMVSLFSGLLDQTKNYFQRALHHMNDSFSIENHSNFQRTPFPDFIDSYNQQSSPLILTKRLQWHIQKIQSEMKKRVAAAQSLIGILQQVGMFLLSLKKVLKKWSNKLEDSKSNMLIELQGTVCRPFRKFNQVLKQVIQCLQRQKKYLNQLRIKNQAYLNKSRDFLKFINCKLSVQFQSLSSIRLQALKLLKAFLFIQEFHLKFENLQGRVAMSIESMGKLVSKVQRFQQDFYFHLQIIKLDIIKILKRLLQNLITLLSDAGDINLGDNQSQIQHVDSSDIIANQQINQFSYNNQHIFNDNDSKDILPSTIQHVNAILFNCYEIWKTSPKFQKKIKKKLFLILNEDRMQGLGQIAIEQVRLQGAGPQVLWIKKKRSEDLQILIDLNLVFNGAVQVLITSHYFNNFLNNINLSARLKISYLAMAVRVCLVPQHLGMGWWSFLTQPQIEFTVEPTVGKYNVKLFVQSYFKQIIQKKLQNLVLPIRVRLEIPLSKKDFKMKQYLQRKMIQKIIKVSGT